jgi:hypothetical protein
MGVGDACQNGAVWSALPSSRRCWWTRGYWVGASWKSRAWIGVSTAVDVHKPTTSLGRPHMPEQGLLQVEASLLPPGPSVPPAKVHQEGDGRAGEKDIIRVRPGLEPDLVRLAHHCRIAAGCEIVTPWTPERVA